MDDHAASANPECAGNGALRRVLVIEDNVDAALTLRDVLEFEGHTVEVAHDGLAGVAAANRFFPDVVLCDIGLPGCDGYEVARSLRSSPHNHRAFLVALTGYALPEDRRRASDAGFDRHLAKPPDLGVLIDLITGAPRADPHAAEAAHAGHGQG